MVAQIMVPCRGILSFLMLKLDRLYVPTSRIGRPDFRPNLGLVKRGSQPFYGATTFNPRASVRITTALRAHTQTIGEG
ncbi:hypothetical protein HNR05_000289 [Leifsonia psychrotolerans]|uniref:Uncharacterized protein n=1 Tax=Glaciibacter psychrotolerans TaxID=670054 RepID=A0A7Z0EBB7_9MICO|nr:hypothetical protein [Leifsonia psychrotolerans]